ncbi:MAG: isoleucine--tRNA ligase [Patescibacteria group bacterium]|jgi:isoleucyl-tRNA synthetase
MENKLSPFAQTEERVLKFWSEAEIFKKSVERDAPRGDYVFYDGPPFATGTPHYGHLVASIMKDVVPRYFTMQGYHVARKWGWDCHGLPIENIVEKEMGTKNKKEIENLGVGKFNDLCRSKVFTYVDEWKKVIRRLGRWADMDNPYRTMDLDYMETIWWALKGLWDKGLIYKDYRSMHICPRCETTLSQSEVAEGYKDIKDLSCTAKFKLKAGQKYGAGKEIKDSAYILAWTTTPWTLVGNVALAVGDNIRYAAVRVKDIPELLIVAGERVAEVFKDKEIEIIHDDILGSDLAGLEYEPLFDYYYSDEKLENRANGWKVYAADFVTTEDGTGVVHIAPAFGEDDMNLGKQNNLPFIQHVGLDGLFKPEVKGLAGLHVKPIDDHSSTDVEIIKYLAARGALFSKEKYEHSYPHCWRCDTPLINYATSSWFVAVTKLKADLLEYAKKINWSPEYIKNGRFGNWLEGARDWSISRQRFWASAIPIWECACGERRMIGSVAELERLTGQKITDIHKDKVDPLTFPCAKCGGTMKRISDVLDCWFESGSMPYAQLHYPFENKEKLEKNFPAQFIAEGVDQCRTWFYYLHVISGGLKKTRAFNNVIANGIVLAEDGKKMSKRLQNYPDPSLVMDKYGADALRACLLASPVMLAENLNFSEKSVEEALRKNIMLLENVYKFYEMYADKRIRNNDRSKSDNVLDRWILAKYDLLLKEVTEAMAKYSLPKAMRPITDFIDEFSTWYLRRSRDRFKAEGKDKQAALAIMRYILTELAKIISPFLPFIGENLWQRVSGYDFSSSDQSVHLEKWPQSPRSFLSSVKNAFHIFGHHHEVLEKMALTRRLVELGLAKRDEAGIKIRQMLSRATVIIKEKSLAPEYLDLIKDELNVQQIVWREEEKEYPLLSLDTALTPELRQEGLKRELIRFINLLRKETGLNLGDRAQAYVAGASSELVAAADIIRPDILRETLSDSWELVEALPAEAARKEIKIDGEVLAIGLVRV